MPILGFFGNLFGVAIVTLPYSLSVALTTVPPDVLGSTVHHSWAVPV